jgi:hypothetical protein
VFGCAPGVRAEDGKAERMIFAQGYAAGLHAREQAADIALAKRSQELPGALSLVQKARPFHAFYVSQLTRKGFTLASYDSQGGGES